jgi:cation:H+ antiporter
MFQYILFVIGFTLLIEGANLLVEGASSVGRRLNVSDLVIGLTVVAFGTSLPELFVNIFAGVRGDTDIAIGNVLGSNIANILLILGVSALISPLAVGKGTVWKEIPLSLLAALLLGIMANDHLIDGSSTSALTRIDGLVLLAFFVIFLYYSFGIAKRIDGLDKHLPAKQYGLLKSFLLIAAGLAGLGVGANWIVGAAVQIASRIGVSQSLIGLTIVALGTSLPELATSAVAAYRKNAEIAVGNIIGSNIFNIFFILGLSAVIKPLPFSPGSNIDIGVVILASLLLFVWMFTGKKRSLDRWEGMIFLILYGIYITFLVLKS